MIRHIFGFILLGSMLLGSFAMISAQDDLIQIAQWARDAEASSQYGEDNWSAEQATGRPDVEACEDNPAAWASETYDDEEYLTVSFRDEVIPTQLNIYQNLTPGAIVAIEIIPDDRDIDPVVFSVRDPSDECPSVLSINFPEGMPVTDEITIYLEQDRVGYWNEIDAVELVGLLEDDEDEAEESSIEENAYPEYEVFEVDVDTKGGRTIGSDDTEDAAYDTDWGRDVECRDGGQINDGVELVVVQQRTGNQYRVTAVGLDGFDPVLGVTITGAYDDALCNDDDAEAATYGANLPTTGNVDPSSTSSQVIFNLNSNATFEDVSIVVGGFGDSSGEFIVIIEGMYASSLDGVGDPMSLVLSPALIESGANVSAYMVSVVNAFDPFMFLSDADRNQITDRDGNPVACDDAGNPDLCWGESEDLSRSYVSRSGGRTLGGGSFDSMLTLAPAPEDAGLAYNFVMTSYGNTEGNYLVAFHLGIQAEE